MIDYYFEYDKQYKYFKKVKRINSIIYIRTGLRTMLDVQSRDEVARYMQKLSLALKEGRYNP